MSLSEKRYHHHGSLRSEKNQHRPYVHWLKISRFQGCVVRIKTISSPCHPWCRTRIHIHPLACTWAFHFCLPIPQPHLHLRLRCRSPNTSKIHTKKSVANTASSTSYELNVIDNFDYSETETSIFQNESVDIDTEPSYSFDMELDDELIRKELSSPLFTQEREEPANLRQTDHPHEESLLPAQVLFSHTQVREDPCANQVQICLKNGNQVATWKQTNLDSLWKTPRANSCWSQIWDSAARTSSRFWQKKDSGITWNYWFSATGNWSIPSQGVSNPGEINYHPKKKDQNKIGITVKLASGICETWKNCSKVTCSRSRNFQEENWLKTLRK